MDDNHAVQAMTNDGLKAKGPKLVTACSVAEAPAPDSDVIKRAQEGDADAFAALFHAHKARIYSVCLRMTNNATEAEDLAQDAFLQVFRKIATFRGDSAFSTWLHRIAVNTVLMHFRKKSLNQVSLEEPYNDSDGANIRREYGAKDNRLAGCVDRVALTCAIKELPRGYRTIFLLHEVQGYDHQEIAEMLGCCVGNSKSQLHKAKLRIRERLVRSPKACPRPFELVITRRTRRATICEVGAVHRAECRNVADIGHSLQLIPTSMAAGRQDELPKAGSSAQRDFLG
jgi:RNA polymerase sigma-70 factor (ECF subfamily)